MLQKNEWSHWHRLTKNEILHFYKGDPLIIFTSNDGVDFTSITIGGMIIFILLLRQIIGSL